jgi:uncharacterized repeat protein (TIGR03803 family)
LAWVVVLLILATAVISPAQQLTYLYAFHGPDGKNPSGPLVQGFDGNFYGATYNGGTDPAGDYATGTLFKLTPNHILRTLHDFCSGNGCPAGDYPTAGLALSLDGNFYGTAHNGGNGFYDGTVFKISPAGALTTLYQFCSQANCADGALPNGELVLGVDGNLYGTTYDGGSNCTTNSGCGTVFKISPQGTLTTLHSFCVQTGCSDGKDPLAGLIQATDGNFYGTADTGGPGSYGNGVLYKITPQGDYSVLYKFCPTNVYPCSDGSGPMAPLVQGTDGNLYGTTVNGGAAFSRGTIFKISTTGVLTTLYTFCAQYGCPDGDGPHDGLIQASDGNFYGTTFRGGVNNAGVLFRITPDGAFTTLASFGRGGIYQSKALFQATNGTIYVSNYSTGNGSILALSPALPPFIRTLPTSGQAGAQVVITGTKLTGATAVKFNGTDAAFTVVSATEITTSVPTGATTGKVEVTLPSGTLSTTVAFEVQ